ncbi:glutathione peroxidase [Marinimicrobium alkaliphilum]|uniref:glutathione peroxidase n=1 Tax=Marinimicrobium alkaliphilum TaxID=2202654 RepID=UPI000DBA2062|nr:glutathione peroxidase [Marinimicrobium alkaliphilum]
MKTLTTTFLLSLLGASAALHADQCPEHLQGEYRQLHATESVDLCELMAGRTALVVNTASHCGFTPQFEALERVHQQYKDQGLVVIGFASNDFRQEAATEEEAATVCYENFGVTFTMVAPTGVTGDEANPLFRELANQSEAPGWNFNKYLVNAEGNVVQHFGSRVTPDSAEVTDRIDPLL